MIDILVPPEQEGTKAVVRGWLKQVGDVVAADEPLVELDTDKVSQEIASPGAGVLVEILLHTDDEATPGVVLGRLRESGEPTAALPSAAVAADAPAPPYPAPAPAAPQHLSPAVRRAVAEHRVDTFGLIGTGRGGRLTRGDIDRHVAERGTVSEAVPAHEPARAPPVTNVSRPAPDASSGSRSRSTPHDRMRRTIAENMLRSVTVAPHVTAVFEADLTAISAHRRKHKTAFEREGVNLSFTAYMVAAAVEAMKAAPAINSRWHDDRLEIFDEVNVGVGASLGDRGLVVPVIQRAQDLSLQGIAARLSELTSKARDSRLPPEDLRGGTFTISNHGVSGSLIATPIIIAQPQSAILGVGKLEKRVVVREVDGADAIAIRPMAYVTLTIDHRVVDGHQTNGWLSRFVEVIEGWPL